MARGGSRAGPERARILLDRQEVGGESLGANVVAATPRALLLCLDGLGGLPRVHVAPGAVLASARLSTLLLWRKASLQRSRPPSEGQEHAPAVKAPRVGG